MPGIAIISSNGVITGISSFLFSTDTTIMVSYAERGITKNDTVSVIFSQSFC